MDPGSDEMTKRVSVVVASFSGEHVLARCLDSILAQRITAEIIVATNADGEEVGRLSSRYTDIRFVQCPAGADVFALRSAGVKQANGQVVVLTEGHCTVCVDWLPALLDEQDRGHRIVGGPVENGHAHGAYNWALYFSEYGCYMPPHPPGQARVVSGINIAYDCELLRSCEDTWRQEFRENEVHEVLGHRGAQLCVSPAALVYSHLEFGFAEAIAHLFSGGRRFGGHRRLHSSRTKKVFWMFASPAIPVVLLGRITLRVMQRNPRRLWPLLMSTPFLVSLVGAWSLGEVAGCFGLNSRSPTTEPSH